MFYKGDINDSFYATDQELLINDHENGHYEQNLHAFDEPYNDFEQHLFHIFGCDEKNSFDAGMILSYSYAL
jgi:hypothetical protein